MRPVLSRKLEGFGTTIFSEMTRLAIEHRAINLAQGFPDFDGPEFAKEAAFTAKTRAILVNTPHNPTGKVFSREELSDIARLCIERDVLCITDEVYEHLVYEGSHTPIASLPGMRERTITISSFGKTFSL